MSETTSSSLKTLYLKLSLLNERLENLFALLRLYMQNLHEFKMREAKAGSINPPINLSHEIEETRLKIAQLEQEIQQIENSIRETREEIETEERKSVKVPVYRFGTFLEWPALNEYAKEAKELFISGGSLDNLIQLYGNFLVNRANEGCMVQLVLMNPDSSAIPQIDLWSSPDLPKEYFRRAICRSLRHLRKIDKERKLKIRLDPSIPALTVMILNGSHADGKIRVDLQPFQAEAIERPVFELFQEGDDIKWYNMFLHQYSEVLWSMATPVDLDNLPPEFL